MSWRRPRNENVARAACERAGPSPNFGCLARAWLASVSRSLFGKLTLVYRSSLLHIVCSAKLLEVCGVAGARGKPATENLRRISIARDNRFVVFIIVVERDYCIQSAPWPTSNISLSVKSSTLLRLSRTMLPSPAWNTGELSSFAPIIVKKIHSPKIYPVQQFFRCV